MSRAYFDTSLEHFLDSTADSIIGILTQNHPQALERLQTNAWLSQIEILKKQLLPFSYDATNSHIFFEFMIPRMGKRADVVLIHQGIIFVIEFKVGADCFYSADIRQTHGYALDLKNFHEGSHLKLIVPILVATDAKDNILKFTLADDNVADPILIGQKGIESLIQKVTNQYDRETFDPCAWMNSRYKPTPTIIEAAQALYSNHKVDDISRSDAGAKNMAETSSALLEIIHQSRINKCKAICFVTGVPGAGKTLVGLNIATQHAKPKDDEHVVFLSGNGPLVDVLREALARDESSRDDKISKAASYRKASQFIQNIHHFRDEAIQSTEPPVEKVIIFDEAQRAWDQEQASKFMRQKRGLKDFSQSEPEFLIEAMNRHKDWCVVIALIGGGQEINTGEAGIEEWFNAMNNNFTDWNIYYSTELTTDKYVAGNLDLKNIVSATKAKKSLHLSTSMRSFRSENLSEMVHYLIAGNTHSTLEIYNKFKTLFPIKVTRNLITAKTWIKEQSRATETKGLIASSGGIRLKPTGVFVKNRFQAKEWFLNDNSDTRSCHYLEDVATEFDIQGLELDWCLIAWDADFRFNGNNFEHWKFIGSKWNQRLKADHKRYLENAYRVLLTRARQGMVIFIPEGDDSDPTRLKEYYDHTFSYLKSCGIDEIK